MPELDRRSFLKVVGLSAGAAATVACKDPIEKVVPYLNQPEEIIPGRATLYASTCRECPCACSSQVKTREGRPIKVDGNPLDPMLKGKMCIRGQASLHRTFDASRLRGPLRRGDKGFEAVSWDDALAGAAEKIKPAVGTGRIAFLGGLETGTLGSLIDQFLAGVGSSRRTLFELYAYEALRQANQQLFGLPSVPQFEIGKADVLLAFGTDFLETWINPVQNQIGFVEARKGGKSFAAFVGPRLSLSGSNCDLWLAPKPGTEIQIALGLAREVAQKRGSDVGPLRQALDPYSLENVAQNTGVPLEALRGLAARAVSAKSLLALPPGNEIQGPNATAFAAAVQLLNHAAGSVGKTVVFGPDHNLRDVARYRDLVDLRRDLEGGAIDVLIVHQANPVYAMPGFEKALAKTTLISFSSTNDETTALASFVLPDHTPYEAWGDAQPVLGVRRIQQPTVRPLFNTRAAGDVLIDLANRIGKPLAGGDFQSRVAGAWKDWNAALAKGGEVAPTAPTTVALAANAGTLRFESFEPAGQGDLTLLVYPSLNLFDGRSARNAVLQEIPDPVTKLVWGSYAELHPETARQLEVKTADVVKISTERGSIEIPAFVHEALRPGIVAVSVGQGHQPVDPTQPLPDRHQRRNVIGANVLQIVPEKVEAASGALQWFGARARVERTGEQKLLANTQYTFDQEGRGIGQAIPLAALIGGAAAEATEGEPLATGEGSRGEPAHHREKEAPYADALRLETKPFDPALDALDPNYRWGMSIDLDACTGCGACVTACVQENNIPAIGETLVRQGREMHWIRIERYVDHKEDQSLAVRHVPMLCQHCGAAPCESVCPVYATYHSKEGLNVMVPNRCIGTRYCGNNCPYKVRRFNYFPYDFDYREPENLQLNPDVMVRSKGVMEKCTFCVQRINGAKDAARVEGRGRVREGEVVPACAQSCPSNAIVFGNYKDPDSAVTRLRSDPRAYWVFHHLNTRPAVTYQKSIERPLTEES